MPVTEALTTTRGVCSRSLNMSQDHGRALFAMVSTHLGKRPAPRACTNGWGESTTSCCQGLVVKERRSAWRRQEQTRDPAAGNSEFRKARCRKMQPEETHGCAELRHGVIVAPNCRRPHVIIDVVVPDDYSTVKLIDGRVLHCDTLSKLVAPGLVWTRNAFQNVQRMRVTASLNAQWNGRHEQANHANRGRALEVLGFGHAGWSRATISTIDLRESAGTLAEDGWLGRRKIPETAEGGRFFLEAFKLGGDSRWEPITGQAHGRFG